MRQKRVRGATLVELVMTIVIISVAIAGVVGA
ncbi:MAG: type II secretion system protein, partial [Marinobacter sp.]|nr:type II secretion system protein [Marinobacter sp.]